MTRGCKTNVLHLHGGMEGREGGRKGGRKKEKREGGREKRATIVNLAYINTVLVE